MNSKRSNNLGLKFHRFTPSGCTDIGIIKFYKISCKRKTEHCRSNCFFLMSYILKPCLENLWYLYYNYDFFFYFLMSCMLYVEPKVCSVHKNKQRKVWGGELKFLFLPLSFQNTGLFSFSFFTFCSINLSSKYWFDLEPGEPTHHWSGGGKPLV